jgi:hypothetical protein
MEEQLWPERSMTKDFWEANRLYHPWIQAEDNQLLYHFLVIELTRKVLEKQPKNRWYNDIRKRVHTHLGDIPVLATVLEKGRKGLSADILALKSDHVQMQCKRVRGETFENCPQFRNRPAEDRFGSLRWVLQKQSRYPRDERRRVGQPPASALVSDSSSFPHTRGTNTDNRPRPPAPPALASTA